jgi:hypothetical protein
MTPHDPDCPACQGFGRVIVEYLGGWITEPCKEGKKENPT